MAKLVIERKEQFNAILRSAAILVDGKKVGVVGNGRRLEVEVEPGVHSVQSRMDWLTSAPIEVNVNSGAVARVELSLCTPLLAILAIVGLARYMEMREV